MVTGFEPTTSWSWAICPNHYTMATRQKSSFSLSYRKYLGETKVSQMTSDSEKRVNSCLVEAKRTSGCLATKV